MSIRIRSIFPSDPPTVNVWRTVCSNSGTVVAHYMAERLGRRDLSDKPRLKSRVYESHAAIPACERGLSLRGMLNSSAPD